MFLGSRTEQVRAYGRRRPARIISDTPDEEARAAFSLLLRDQEHRRQFSSLTSEEAVTDSGAQNVARNSSSSRESPKGDLDSDKQRIWDFELSHSISDLRRPPPRPRKVQAFSMPPPPPPPIVDVAPAAAEYCDSPPVLVDSGQASPDPMDSTPDSADSPSASVAASYVPSPSPVATRKAAIRIEVEVPCIVRAEPAAIKSDDPDMEIAPSSPEAGASDRTSMPVFATPRKPLRAGSPLERRLSRLSLLASPWRSPRVGDMSGDDEPLLRSAVLRRALPKQNAPVQMPKDSWTSLLDLCASSQALDAYVPQNFEDVLYGPHHSEETAAVTKIGEASYSEVFQVDRDARGRRLPAEKVVLKVMPFKPNPTPLTSAALQSRNSQRASRRMSHLFGDPATRTHVGPSPDELRLASDLVPEMAMALSMGQLRGFLPTTQVDVVQTPAPEALAAFLANPRPGTELELYPRALLRAWDAFAESEPDDALNSRPRSRAVCASALRTPEPQYFCVAHMAHAGTPLERFKFARARDVRACLLQIAAALARAEAVCEFEHRDLHWGNILVRERTPPTEGAEASGSCNGDGQEPDGDWNGEDVEEEEDDPAARVEATIIDFTVSRCTAGGLDANPTGELDDILFVHLPDDVFTGEGDRQFDVYRAMRDVTQDDWRGYYPKTNVLWLQYLCSKMQTKTRSAKLQRALRSAERAMESSCSAQEALPLVRALPVC